MKKISIENLLIWAFTQECRKREPATADPA
jgi:hypothetical protein